MTQHQNLTAELTLPTALTLIASALNAAAQESAEAFTLRVGDQQIPALKETSEQVPGQWTLWVDDQRLGAGDDAGNTRIDLFHPAVSPHLPEGVAQLLMGCGVAQSGLHLHNGVVLHTRPALHSHHHVATLLRRDDTQPERAIWSGKGEEWDGLWISPEDVPIQHIADVCALFMTTPSNIDRPVPKRTAYL